MGRGHAWQHDELQTNFYAGRTRPANQNATVTTVTAAQTATRLAQTATRISGRERHRTVIVMISDPRARARVVDALAEEGLASLALATRDLSELEGTTPAALVYDLAPWSAAALQFLSRLRSAPWRVAELPVLLYVPPRPEAAQLLVEAGRFSLVRGEMQCDGASEGGRIRGAMRQLLRDAPAAGVFQLLMRHLPDLPSDVQRLCRFACEKLAAHDGAELTVSRAAAELGADRRTLERRLRALGLPMPKELFDWTIVVFAAYVADEESRSSVRERPVPGAYQ